MAHQSPDDAAGRPLSGWGRFPRVDCRILDPGERAEAVALVGREASLIARGNGRAYGDAALNPQATLRTLKLDRLLSFDPDTGLLACEAGLVLADLVALMVPRGWFVPVTPGTKFVTVGGMIAADVHGKNHHGAGSFGAHVRWIDLALADGSVRRCSPADDPELFHATLGGMGLTGVVLAACFRLIPIETAQIRQTMHIAGNLAEAMDLFEAHEDATYSVAWIDCVSKGSRMGRSLLMLGEHARRDEVPDAVRDAAPRRTGGRRVPFDFPSIALNRWSIAAFNELYYRRGRAGTSLIGLEPYFYPLDSLADWNRIYGRGGFLQYQFVLPRESSREGMDTILRRIAEAGTGSFLAVLKLFGPQDGMLSFPMAGYTLALDFPVTSDTLSLMVNLDGLVASYGGRLYLAKDARAGAAQALAGYPRLGEFRAVRERVDPHRRFRSVQSDRLGL